MILTFNITLDCTFWKTKKNHVGIKRSLKRLSSKLCTQSFKIILISFLISQLLQYDYLHYSSRHFKFSSTIFYLKFELLPKEKQTKKGEIDFWKNVSIL